MVTLALPNLRVALRVCPLALDGGFGRQIWWPNGARYGECSCCRINAGIPQCNVLLHFPRVWYKSSELTLGLCHRVCRTKTSQSTPHFRRYHTDYRGSKLSMELSY